MADEESLSPRLQGPRTVGSPARGLPNPAFLYKTSRYQGSPLTWPL